MAARVRHADANEKCGEWLRQGRPKLSPVRSAQQSKTEIEQIPDKLEFGLVFLLLFCSLMFFFFFFSLFSFRLRCQRNFLTFFLLLFLPFCCVFLVSATFPRKISSQIFASYYDYFYIAFRPSSIALPFEKWHFTTVVICFCSCFLLPLFIFPLVRMCDLAATHNNVGWLCKLWVSMWFVVIRAMSWAWWTIYIRVYIHI